MLKYLIFWLLIALVYTGNVIAGQQHDPYTVTPQEHRQMAEKRHQMTREALALVYNEGTEIWETRFWKVVRSKAGIEVVFQDNSYQGCAFVHLEKTGYVPIYDYRPIYDMLVSEDSEKIDDAITLIEIKAMQAGLIPYERPDYPE